MRSTDHAPVSDAAADSLARFAGGVAHEFNNLLAGMMGCASLAQMDVPEGGPAAEALADVQRAGERATALAPQLLAYAGRGLGLANVHATVRQHKGAIQVSSCEGHGTRVHVLLPAAPQS